MLQTPQKVANGLEVSKLLKFKERGTITMFLYKNCDSVELTYISMLYHIMIISVKTKRSTPSQSHLLFQQTKHILR